jgi:hypothetical protein
MSQQDTNSASQARTITPSDSAANNFHPTRGVWVGGAGTVVAAMVDGGTSTFVGVPAGTLLPIQVVRINSTSTTATSMLALY